MFRRKGQAFIRSREHPGHEDALSGVSAAEYQAHSENPVRIVRPFQPKVSAYIGPRYARGFPTTDVMLPVGHVPAFHLIPHDAQGIPRSRWGGIDDRAETPAVFAGNPV